MDAAAIVLLLLRGFLPILLFSAALSSRATHALILRVQSGKVKCLTEDLPAAALSFGEYRISGDPPHEFNISARVTNPKGEVIHLAEKVEAGQFAFKVKVPGQYSACFWFLLFRRSAEISVDVEWRTGMAAKNWNAVAKKGKIDEMETELKKLEDSIDSIYEEMRLLRDREEEAWKLNEGTTSNMGILSLLSFAICMSVAGLQLWHLKTFFEREKIL